ncbi:response regulator transcription factor [Undibacterium sp. RTI2.1]|uniref:response regulator transcription factor n=1 Tax=unclassified Undibacterium TaxID=2630295 RepID=UPI002B22CEF1|nr:MULTISPECIES: response regulator transcription factor [unclassified Undibacterium]MEB0032185.1 response regulator transcription factor [Undibacterium sp. RTI2.1]MEB0118259.1 response regulator transcription factor [Undibacterium sp. RTI2.2]
MRTLLVEDDPFIGEALCQSLRDASYAVDWVRDGHQAVVAASIERYSLILLDLGLPILDGLEVLRQLRERNNVTPILIITAREAFEDRIVGLDLGADDYLVKPFHTGELLARVRALIRRQTTISPSILTCGELSLDPATCEVWYQGTQRKLSTREFSLLAEFLQRPGIVLSRSQLEERLYGWNEEVESNAIEFLIHSIRKKLDSSVIRNIRGMGWLIQKD